MFGMSATELIIIAVLALVLIGPDDLPNAARTIGKTLREIRKAGDDLRDTFDKEIMQEVKDVRKPFEKELKELRELRKGFETPAGVIAKEKEPRPDPIPADGTAALAAAAGTPPRPPLAIAASAPPAAGAVVPAEPAVEQAKTGTEHA